MLNNIAKGKSCLTQKHEIEVSQNTKCSQNCKIKVSRNMRTSKSRNKCVAKISCNKVLFFHPVHDTVQSSSNFWLCGEKKLWCLTNPNIKVVGRDILTNDLNTSDHQFGGWRQIFRELLWYLLCTKLWTWMWHVSYQELNSYLLYFLVYKWTPNALKIGHKNQPQLIHWLELKGYFFKQKQTLLQSTLEHPPQEFEGKICI